MRSLLVLALLSAHGAGAWKLLPTRAPCLSDHTSRAARLTLPSTIEGMRAEGGASGRSFLPFASAGALALLGSVVSAMRRPSRRRRARSSVVTSHAESDDIEYGYRDPQTGKRNYVNPWEERVELTDEQKEEMNEAYRRAKEQAEAAGSDKIDYRRPTPSGHFFHEYTGPVYKKVPIVEGISFPLDPTLYKPPLEPPKPGVKWGDGRDSDGNWYNTDEDGKKIQYWQGWGRRKTACAIVRLVKQGATGQFRINGRSAIDYFNNYPIWWMKACEPLAAMSQKNNFDITARAFGGGHSGQAGAIRYGLAKAIQEYNFNWRPLLKRAKYLTRDWRRVEPKKPGQPKARKKTPYHKR